MTAQVRTFDSGATRNLDAVELAWAAGFFDGEGSTCCTTNNGRKHNRIQLSIGQKNQDGNIADTLVRFQSAVGGCGHIYQKNKHRGPDYDQHQFLVTRRNDVLACLRLLWPYLSLPKRGQAATAIALFNAATGKGIAL